MIYEQAMLEHNYVTEIEACLLDIGFVKVPGDQAIQGDPDKYYWGPDTRREFYLYFNGDGAVRNMSCHISTDEGEYDYQLSPWVQLPCLSMASWTRLYGGGIRFGIRARNEFLFSMGEYPEALTDYKIGYRNEEFYSAFLPAHWFAIIAPEHTGDQWIYVVYRMNRVIQGEVTNILYYIGSVFTEEWYANNPENINNLNSATMDSFNYTFYNDGHVSSGSPIILSPFLFGEHNREGTEYINIQKIYKNIYSVPNAEFDRFNKSYVPVNRILTYNKKNYIIISSNGIAVRLN